MKKYIQLFAWLLLIVLLLTACTQPGTEPASTAPDKTSEYNTKEESGMGDQGAPEKPASTQYRFASWNIAGYSEKSDSHQQGVAQTVSLLNADVIVLNESDASVYTENEELSAIYGSVDTTFGKTKPTPCSVFYRKELFESVSAYTYCLTGTPTKYSKVDGSYHYRFATFAELRVKETGKVFFVIATHLENNSGNSANFESRNEARILQAGYLLDLIRKEIPAGADMVLMGDLNSIRNSQPESYRLGGVTELLESGLFLDSKDLAQHTDLSGSWVAADYSLDYILVSPETFRISDFSVQKNLSVPNPSDHNPIMIICRFAKTEG